MHIRWAWPEIHYNRLIGHIKESWPIGLTELAWAFMWYFCTVVLGFIFSDASLGWFGASHRALMALHTFVWLYFFNLLPSISRCVYLPNERLLELMDCSVRFTAWVGLFSAALLSVISPLVLTLIYGAAFVNGWHSFSVLVWMLPMAMLSGHHRYILLGYNHQQRLLYCTAAAAAAAVGLSFLLVPLYGGLGAAWALLIANAIYFALTYFSVQQLIVKVPVIPQLLAPLLALGVGAGIYLALAKWNFWVAVAAAMLIYISALARSDGPALQAFVQTLVRKPAVKANAA
jgi:O-antigen/teichoic acid export membrane protein